MDNNGINSKEFVSIFVMYANINIDNIKLQLEEVSNIKWISKDEMNVLIENKEVIPHKESVEFAKLHKKILFSCVEMLMLVI